VFCGVVVAPGVVVVAPGAGVVAVVVATVVGACTSGSDFSPQPAAARAAMAAAPSTSSRSRLVPAEPFTARQGNGAPRGLPAAA
jgi:hypothetical protein